MQKTLELLGKRIATLRSKAGLTQEKLAEMVSYSSNHISKLESARTNPSFELLYKISVALNVELQDIFNFDEYKNPHAIQDELRNIINNPEDKKVQLLYKIYQSIKL